MKMMLIDHFLHFFPIFSATFSNTISSEVPGPIDFKCYVRHHGEGLYQSYANYADAAILSGERQGLTQLNSTDGCDASRVLVSTPAVWGQGRGAG